MPILVDCSKCGTRLQAPANTAVRCPKCGVIITARGATAPAAPPQLPPAAPPTALLDLAARQAVCVHCHGRMVYDERVAGRTVTCPQCRKPLLMPTLPANPAPPPVPPPMPPPMPAAPLITQAPPPPTPAAEPVLRSHYRRRPGSDTTANALGGVALLLAVAAFAFALVPRWSWVCVPLSAVAVVLGVGGGVVALMRGGRALGLPVSGTVIGAAALVVGLFFLRAIAELMGTAPKPNVSAPKDDDWVDARKSKVRKDTVKVEVKEAMLDAIRIPDVRPEDAPKGKFLFILLEIENVSEINALDYRSWGDATKAAGEKNAARLKDNLGRTYRRVSFGEETRPNGQLIRETIAPDMTVQDVLVFEAPKEDAEYLLLELPSSAYGGIGALRLKLPADMIKR